MTPRVLTVVSCGSSKQSLADDETVPARELYDSSVHTCKGRYGRHSHGYYIMSAKFGLVHNQTELPEYDLSLDDLSDDERAQWAADVVEDLVTIVDREGFDAVVLIGSKTYIDPILEHVERIPVPVLTPWQTDDYVSGVGRGMAWCNDEANWPGRVDSIEEIAEPRGPTRGDLSR